jgi:hypothetical protein cdiviTM7_00627
MKKTVLSIALMICMVFGASALLATSLSGSVSAQVSDGIDIATTPEMKGKQIEGKGGLIQTVVNVLLWVVGALSVIMIIFSGIRYVTSAGDAAKTKAAQNSLIYAVVGLIVAIFAWAIVNMVIDKFV